MRHKILLTLAFLFSFWVGNINAQGPGFMGKHFYVKYDLGISASLLNVPVFETVLGPKVKHSFSANYIIGKYFSPGISLNRYKVNVRRSFGDSVTNVYPVSETSFFLKIYVLGHNIAPVGTYLIVGTTRLNVDAGDEQNDFNLKTGAFYGGFGISRVLYKKFVIDFSTTLSNVSDFRDVPEDPNFDSGSVFFLNETLQSFNVFQWRVGIGYLLF